VLALGEALEPDMELGIGQGLSFGNSPAFRLATGRHAYNRAEKTFKTAAGPREADTSPEHQTSLAVAYITSSRGSRGGLPGYAGACVLARVFSSSRSAFM